MVTIVDHDEGAAPGAAGAEPAETARSAGSDAGEKLLEEQQARIAALRFAVLSGRVPDEDTFDYARFFGGSSDDVSDDAPGDAPDDAPKG